MSQRLTAVIGAVLISNHAAPAEKPLDYQTFRVTERILYHYHREGAPAFDPVKSVTGVAVRSGDRESLPPAPEAHRRLTGAGDLLDLRPLLARAELTLSEEVIIGFSPRHQRIFARATPEEMEVLAALYRVVGADVWPNYAWQIGFEATLIAAPDREPMGDLRLSPAAFGKLHPGAQVIARQTMITRSGQRARVVATRSPTPEEGDDPTHNSADQAIVYQELEVEPTVSPDGSIDVIADCDYRIVPPGENTSWQIAHDHSFSDVAGRHRAIDLGEMPGRAGWRLLLFERVYGMRDDGTAPPTEDLRTPWIERNAQSARPIERPSVEIGGLIVRKVDLSPFYPPWNLFYWRGFAEPNDQNPFGNSGGRIDLPPVAREVAALFRGTPVEDVAEGLRANIDGVKLAEPARAIYDHTTNAAYLFASPAEVGAIEQRLQSEIDFLPNLRAVLSLANKGSPDPAWMFRTVIGNDGFATLKRSLSERGGDGEKEVHAAVRITVTETAIELKATIGDLRIVAAESKIGRPASSAPFRHEFALQDRNGKKRAEKLILELSPEPFPVIDGPAPRALEGVFERWRRHFVGKQGQE